MTCAHGPTGPPEPVALITGRKLHPSRHYLIALAVTGVVYLLYAFLSPTYYTHDPHEDTRVISDRLSADPSQVPESDHDRASIKREDGDRENALGPPKDWLKTIQGEIENKEYAPRKTASTGYTEYRLANRRHGFVSHVHGASWDISPHSDPVDPRAESTSPVPETRTPPWTWKYTFASIHRGQEKTPIQPGVVSEDGKTVTIDRSAGVKEWYRNRSDGIEQGFEIAERMHSHASGELVLRGTVETTLKVPTPGRDKIVFTHGGMQTVQYAGLKVIDATGATVPAWLSYQGAKSGGILDIHINDASAVYPLTVDPVASSAAWSVESNQASAWLGWSVSTAGDVNGDGFSDVIVGAYLYDNGQSNEGGVFVYHGSATGLPTTATWTRESDQASAQMGFSVSTAGDVNGDGYSDVIVGANLFDNGESNEGQVSVYHGSSSGLATTAAWRAEANASSTQLGDSISTAGDVNGDGYSDVIAGATLYDNGSMNEGKAFVYHGSASGLALRVRGVESRIRRVLFMDTPLLQPVTSTVTVTVR